jgi:hypothetical protein
MSKPSVHEETLGVMGALVRMPPKSHDQMKLGKPRSKRRVGKGAKRRAHASKKM